MENVSRKHLILKQDHFSRSENYEYTGMPPLSKTVPPQERKTHARSLQNQLSSLSREMAAAIAIQEESKSILDKGLIVEFESFEGIGEIFEKQNVTPESELLNTRRKNGKVYATVFIPDGALKKFEDKINAYISYKKKANGDAADNQRLIDSIKNFKKATVKALWTDAVPMPASATEVMCWEVWLSNRENHQKQKEGFTIIAKNLGIEVSESCIIFRDRSVLLVRATTKQLEQSLDLLNNISELRKAKTLADFFTELPRNDQIEWQDDLIKRLILHNSPDDVPYICILDTGINAAHPLLTGSIAESDIFTINLAWGKNDIVGHGTEVAGLALLGDLTEVLEMNENIEVTHRLESSKIINAAQVLHDDARRPLDLYAEFTRQAVSQAEIPNINRKRIFQMAITTIDSWDNGRPSSWSSVLDMLAFGTDNNQNPRLFIVSAGNVNGIPGSNKYPKTNLAEGIRDPAQAWNVLTVGAYTEKDILSDSENFDGNKPTAMHGELSPYSTTSHSWDGTWPLKPDIVMEGGNTAVNYLGQAQAHSLSLLSTNHEFAERPFSPIWATSAASALASKMCIKIIKAYPELRSETVRALMIHCASWTSAMQNQFGCATQKTSKTPYNNLVRICGYGVPDISRALASFKNDFTMIIEDNFQPFKIDATRKMNQMKFYDLPFPSKELENLGNTPVVMRVTLSYFIEPNPSSRGRSVYSYKSHGLRFAVKTPAETKDHFMGKVTRAMQDENEDYKTEEPDKWWKIGVNGRTKGSIHSDIWQGSAAELASCGTLAVYPVSGWWRYYKKDKAVVNNTAYYSLLISIKTSADIDLMSATEIIIKNKTETPIDIIL
jgi:hypothetical protein